MRVLHVSYIYPRTLCVADGITNVVCNVTGELAHRGHEVSVYTSGLRNLQDASSLQTGHLLINGVQVYYSKSILKYKTFAVTPSIIRLLRQNIEHFDLVHIHDCRSFQGIVAFIFAVMKHVPYIFQPHGSY